MQRIMIVGPVGPSFLQIKQEAVLVLNNIQRYCFQVRLVLTILGVTTIRASSARHLTSPFVAMAAGVCTRIPWTTGLHRALALTTVWASSAQENYFLFLRHLTSRPLASCAYCSWRCTALDVKVTSLRKKWLHASSERERRKGKGRKTRVNYGYPCIATE